MEVGKRGPHMFGRVYTAASDTPKNNEFDHSMQMSIVKDFHLKGN